MASFLDVGAPEIRKFPVAILENQQLFVYHMMEKMGKIMAYEWTHWYFIWMNYGLVEDSWKFEMLLISQKFGTLANFSILTGLNIYIS